MTWWSELSPTPGLAPARCPRQMGYPLSVRGQVRRAQGPLPCVAATVLCSWRLPSLGRVPMSSVPRRRRYYEGATTSPPASRLVLVRDRVPRGPPRFVLAEALPGGWRSRPSLGRLVRRRPGSGWRPRGRGGISQVPRRSIPCLCPAQRPRPNQWSLTKAVPPMLPPRPTRRRLQRSHDLEAATGLQHPLPTLRTRRCRRPRKARFRLAGWPLPGEGRTLRIATKGFRAFSRRPPFQGLPCRKLGARTPQVLRAGRHRGERATGQERCCCLPDRAGGGQAHRRSVRDRARHQRLLGCRAPEGSPGAERALCRRLGELAAGSALAPVAL